MVSKSTYSRIIRIIFNIEIDVSRGTKFKLYRKIINLRYIST